MRKLFAAGTIAALATAGIVASAGTASAINRVSCNESGYTWIVSSDTTCWANAGTVGVALYGVYAVNSGNNAGWLASPSGYVFFPNKFSTYQFSNRRIDTVHID
ncbi:beta/gamma crystallin domain-containing protein [Actinokineospora enzanensis]|uniref:beta/gamma crystallin domain-containing protein n=1 Tax=Actinokineospora enzanensis TaxID=155975 RepID=UPI0003754926|nr:beta/gamma crystallin domain-containing protein [Actinokineospora enzanensis]